MKKKMLTGLQLLLLAASMAIVGASVAPPQAEASASECPIRCNDGPYQCTWQADCWWSCT